jgi:hypothetical protein
MTDTNVTIGDGGLYISRDSGDPRWYLERLNITWESDTTLTIMPGSCRDEDDNVDITLDVVITNDNGAVGANGIDVGVPANSTWYYVWLIRDISGANPVASLVSLSATAPTMPAGYDVRRRIGSVRVDANGDYLKFFQSGFGFQKFYQWDAESSDVGVNEITVLFNGGALAYAAVSLLTAMPPIAREAYLNIIHESDNLAALDHIFVRVPGSAVVNATDQTQSASANNISGAIGWVRTGSIPSIEYRVSIINVLCTIHVVGYIEVLEGPQSPV